MNCIVTGGAGFIGSHLVDRLIQQGDKVAIIDDLSSGKAKNINKSAEFYKLKIESNKIENVFRKLSPEVIFHLAAQASVVNSTNNPDLDAKANIIGTINLLKLCIKHKVKKIVFSTTGGALYGNTTVAATEEVYPSPASPYGISKFTGEQYIKFFGNEFNLEYCILRYANVYGPRQDPKGEAGVVAIFTQNMIKNKTCTLFGSGKLKRDYVYVKDVIEANILAIKLKANETLNIGTGIPTSVNELFELMGKFSNYSISPVYMPKRTGEIEISFLNYAKAKRLLGWEPKTSLADGLQETIKSFNEKIRGGKDA
ncbi:MAG: NAD-dependent epimerase/dehydratase family protein [bacterium]|nr:NAD-dependent epimerase/dehydratase family protein [bacterium]